MMPSTMMAKAFKLDYRWTCNHRQQSIHLPTGTRQQLQYQSEGFAADIVESRPAAKLTQTPTKFGVVSAVASMSPCHAPSLSIDSTLDRNGAFEVLFVAVAALGRHIRQAWRRHLNQGHQYQVTHSFYSDDGYLHRLHNLIVGVSNPAFGLGE